MSTASLPPKAVVTGRTREPEEMEVSSYDRASSLLIAVLISILREALCAAAVNSRCVAGAARPAEAAVIAQCQRRVSGSIVRFDREGLRQQGYRDRGIVCEMAVSERLRSQHEIVGLQTIWPPTANSI